MPFTVPSYDAIRNAILRDIRNQLPDAAVGSDSDNFVRAAGVGAAIEGVYQHQAWLYRQIWPDTADPDELEHHAANRGLKLKPAVAAVGSVTLTGTKGLWLAPGQALRHNASGAGLVTTASVTLGDGPTAVSVVALESGAAANGLQGAGTLTSPPLGVDSGARLATLTGGVDAETHAELLARLLDLMQHPPAGGTVHDYRRWALAVPGVTLVIVLPRRRGVGTVDLVITSADGLPSEDTLDAVRNHLDNVGPVGADWQVHAPQLLNVDLRAQVRLASGYTLDDVRGRARVEMAALFGRLLPGDTFYRSQAEAVLSNLAGVLDRRLLIPQADVAGPAGSVTWVRLGTFALEAMP
ncbi:baseplate J/gp47 family protein [Pseudomonas aeruginosa]|uniref:baseplate J/gp47 family protein n=1 Tax=Pseudomonas aeruginosa TaxID=287 RepID=UPI000BB726EF|nr:baseplate J/gp47 family protein [Pseudomonas aeruginosa]AXR10010.1 baseplate J/gp47 family protein [Pseudomonas aeruginosa]EIU2598549.1 baseplate J/gp47 family protein [Pseudomonas aeruginosa]EIU2879849.1 baseplate J/gp47 family protein [Pseudomonas aeruginosa]ELC7283666.1 baseplate J/gp47 family protein [Pseudomonas aeruginosa]ELK4865890.1 baseplate J/gp47 family protein [Pseudomonas aeruginosa]